MIGQAAIFGDILLCEAIPLPCTKEKSLKMKILDKSAAKLISLFFSLFAVIANGLSNQTQASPDLSKFSSVQLKACYDDKTICVTEDHFAISGELANRLPTFSTKQLVACFADWKICGAADSLATGWQISDVIAKRGNPHLLLTRYWSEPDREIRDGIVHVAYHFSMPEVAAFMQKILSAGNGDDDELYWPANYLAKRCDPEGLKWLSMLRDRPEGCLQWAPTVALFGKCHYRPATPYLVNYSLHDACLNIVDAAEIDLRAMYPNSPKEFSSIEDMQKYFCARTRKAGFQVRCGSK